MTQAKYLFDSNIIYKLIRETPEKAIDKLMEGTTIRLAYYELGNALWRESRLLKRISLEEAQKSLSLMYAMLSRMEIADVETANGDQTLEKANKLGLTFYDAAYLVEACKRNAVLVTDDNKLAKAAENLGVTTISSDTLTHN
jgi:predicted nucleic acid-binding protein